MRFSAVFQLPVPLPRAAQAAERAGAERAGSEKPASAEAKAPPPALPQELPEDLDARVRLVGEWQLGEG